MDLDEVMQTNTNKLGMSVILCCMMLSSNATGIFNTAYTICLLGSCNIVYLLMLSIVCIHCDRTSFSTSLYCAKPTSSILNMSVACSSVSTDPNTRHEVSTCNKDCI